MKKRIIAWAVLLSVCAAALGLWCSAAAGKAARTLPCEEEGLILSITTFDGKSESKPFLKCFGHTAGQPHRAHGLPERPCHPGRRDGHLLGLGGVWTFGAAVRSGTVLYRPLRTLHRQTVSEHQYRGRAAEGHRGLHGTAR